MLSILTAELLLEVKIWLSFMKNNLEKTTENDIKSFTIKN